MAVRGSWAILPIQIDQVLAPISVALDHRRCYLRVIDETAPECDPANFQFRRTDLVTR